MQAKGIILTDTESWSNLLPLTFTKPVAKLRLGYYCIDELWLLGSQLPVSYKTEKYLQSNFPLVLNELNYFVNSSVVPNKAFINEVLKLEDGESLKNENTWLATCTAKSELADLKIDNTKIYNEPVIQINRPADIFKNAAAAIKNDVDFLPKEEFTSTLNNDYTIAYNLKDCHFGKNLDLTGLMINATKGPVIIEDGAEVMEGAMLRGPLAIRKGAVVKMGAKIYGATTLGPFTKVGGELSNVVIQGYSNKGHDGYLGNSVIGEWCNLGADTNCSNLKNNYGEVKTWSYTSQSFENSNTIFHGLIMGDHSKCSINTMFNTGTVVGVFANIFGGGFHDKFIPSFTWGKTEVYNFDKAIEVAQAVAKRRDIQFSDKEIEILKNIFNQTKTYRENKNA